MVEEILQRFPVGAVSAVQPVRSGLIHTTWIIDAAAGRFVLQRLHPKLATPEILHDYAAVTAHLAARGLPAPRLVSVDGDHHVVIRDGRWFRLTTYVPGETRDEVTSAQEAEEGARALARFHRATADLDLAFRSDHPLHDTTSHLAALREATSRPKHGELALALAAEIAEVEEALPALILPPSLPRRVVHGDPKISNVRFLGGRAIGLIDLDTCNRHSVLVDLGDAIRSWCRDRRPEAGRPFRLDWFEAALRGYAAEGPPLQAEERARLGEAGRLITLELASRFLRDALEDAYFAWDPERYPSRRAHNMARAREMLALAADMHERAADMEAAVSRCFGG